MRTQITSALLGLFISIPLLITAQPSHALHAGYLGFIRINGEGK